MIPFRSDHAETDPFLRWKFTTSRLNEVERKVILSNIEGLFFERISGVSLGICCAVMLVLTVISQDHTEPEAIIKQEKPISPSVL